MEAKDIIIDTSELVTDARVEVWVGGKNKRWLPVKGQSGTVPFAVERGRAYRAGDLQDVAEGHRKAAAPVRVIDTAGKVVAQWGKP